VARISLATVVMAGASYVVWWLFDAGLGRSLIAQIVSMGLAVSAAILVYAGCVIRMNIPEAHQIRRLLPGRARV